MQEKTRKTIQKACDIMELCIALAVGVGLVVSVILYIPLGVKLLTSSSDTAPFLLFLEDMFSFIVGVEFIKMLCKPSAENVIEVLVFLVARHLILGTNSAVDILLSVVAVALLYGTRLLLRHFKQHPAPDAPEAEAEETLIDD